MTLKPARLLVLLLAVAALPVMAQNVAVVNGKPQVPYLGVGKYKPNAHKAAPPVRSSRDYPDDGDKRAPDLETALRKCGLHDGMVISNHHHLRDGDSVALMALEAAAKVGVKDLMWFPSASFPSQKSAIELMERGVIHHIEGSMNGPLGDYCTQGRMRGMGVLRSHGGRWQAVQDGDVHIDIAVIAAPTADAFGNADGSHGKSACGSLEGPIFKLSTRGMSFSTRTSAVFLPTGTATDTAIQRSPAEP